MARFDARELGGWDQDVSSLAGTLVHEIKNPLSTLNINTQLILEEWHGATTPRETRMIKRLQVMQSEISRIEHITNSFLRLVKQPELDFADFDVNILLEELVSDNREVVERGGVRLLFQSGDGSIWIHGDAGLLRQAFLNLIRNAEQAMPDGGELMIRSRHGDGKTIIEVTDTGIGMPEARLPRIFKPYFSSKQGGTGLGLPTTLRIVRQHGGHIVVESEEGKGCRFIVTLPSDSGTESRAAGAAE